MMEKLGYDLVEAWPKALEALKTEVTSTVFSTFLQPLKPVAEVHTSGKPTLVLEVANHFYKNVMTNTYSSSILRKLQEVTMTDCDLLFILPGERGVYETPKTEEPVIPNVNQFNRKYTFDSFVVGNSNRFAHAASLAVAEQPGEAYNPLFIYGGVGLGKTHLLQAIGRYINEQQPHLRVCYVSSEKFTNELIYAIGTNTTDQFRSKYRNNDVLLIDDVQFLAGKERTTEELFHTFNGLFEEQKQIILSSDRQPRQINIEDRLRSRFEWGLTADIQPPDIETRIAILHRKAQMENIIIEDEDVFEFIAQRAENNIRELEGALNRAIAFAKVSQKPLDLSLVQEAPKDMIDSSTGRLATPETILHAVSERFGVEITDILGKSKLKEIAQARQIAMYLTRELTDLSTLKLGDFFGRDHTTVLHGWRTISNRMAEDKEFRTMLGDIRATLIGH